MILIGGFIAYNSLRFKIVKASPVDNTFPSSQSEIVYFFNKNLNTKVNDNEFVTKIIPSHKYTTKILDKSFHIMFTEPVKGQFTVEVYNISSTSGDIIKKIVNKYRVGYVPESKLSKYEIDKRLNSLDLDTAKYPIIKILPIYADYYIINYQISDGALAPNINPTPPLILKIRVLGVNRLVPPQASYVENVHKMALNDIKSRGYDLTKFTIIFDDSPM
jgi:hypothetical protein